MKHARAFHSNLGKFICCFFLPLFLRITVTLGHCIDAIAQTGGITKQGGLGVLERNQRSGRQKLGKTSGIFGATVHCEQFKTNPFPWMNLVLDSKQILFG